MPPCPPSRPQDFINNYKRALSYNRKTIEEMSARLSGGLQKLIQAATEVDAMQKELSEAKVVVEQATKECNELLEVISTNTADVGVKQASATTKEAQLKIDSESIAVEKAEAEAALEEAIPALEEAAAALADLRKEDITEIRSFAKPHVLVQKVGGQGAGGAGRRGGRGVFDVCWTCVVLLGCDLLGLHFVCCLLLSILCVACWA